MISKSAFTQVITNFGGGGSSLGDGGSATIAQVPNPYGGVFDSKGNYYLATSLSSPRIRMIDSMSIIHTVVGTGIPGFSGDLGSATSAKLSSSFQFTVDDSGNIYIADCLNYRIRKVDHVTGIIKTIAGNGIQSVTGNGGAASAATLVPNGICVDKIGNLYVIDSQGVWLRKIDTGGVISLVAGIGIAGFTGDSGSALLAKVLIHSVCIDIHGDLLLGCLTRIRKIDLSSGIITSVAGTGLGTYNMDEIHADSANFTEYGICADDIGNIYISDYNSRIRKIDTFGIIHTVAGNGVIGYSGDNGPATMAQLHFPEGIAVDLCGNLYIADEANSRIRKVTYDTSCNPHSYHGSLNIFNQNLELIISPNPVSTVLSISNTGKLSEISICNFMGQTIFIQTFNTTKAEIDMSGYPAGVYIVRVRNKDGGQIVKKIIKD